MDFSQLRVYFSGELVPLAEATPAALASNMPADVVGFYPGSFSATWSSR